MDNLYQIKVAIFQHYGWILCQTDCMTNTTHANSRKSFAKQATEKARNDKAKHVHKTKNNANPKYYCNYSKVLYGQCQGQ